MELLLWTVLKLPHKPVWPTGFPACLICRWHFIRVRWEAEQRGMCQIGELCKRCTKKLQQIKTEVVVLIIYFRQLIQYNKQDYQEYGVIFVC